MYCCDRAWSVKSKLRMIFFYIILHPAVLIYDFLIFIPSSSSFYGFNTNQLNDLLWVGLLAQLSKVRILYKPEFFQAFFSQLQKLRHYNCDDLLSCKNYFCGVSLKHLLVCFVRKDHPVFINFQSMPQPPDLYIVKLCTQVYFPSNFKLMEFGENCRLSPFDYGLPGLISKFGFLLKFTRTSSSSSLSFVLSLSSPSPTLKIARPDVVVACFEGRWKIIPVL